MQLNENVMSALTYMCTPHGWERESEGGKEGERGRQGGEAREARRGSEVGGTLGRRERGRKMGGFDSCVAWNGSTSKRKCTCSTCT